MINVSDAVCKVKEYYLSDDGSKITLGVQSSPLSSSDAYSSSPKLYFGSLLVCVDQLTYKWLLRTRSATYYFTCPLANQKK